MRRRRFLAVAAGFAAYPAFAATPLRWEGVALGAAARLELAAPEDVARPALAAALREIEAVEAAFSLYRPGSDIVRLNARGRLDGAGAIWDVMLDMVDRVHGLTEGFFDPTVQPVWTARAGATTEPWDAIGWAQVVRPNSGAVALGAGQALTLNGIAQGFATDRVVAALRAHGLTDAFIDIGEQAALGRSRRLGLVDPAGGLIGPVTLVDAAMATSSPGATPLAGGGHILNPRDAGAAPVWSTVSVEAESAALADGLSTALVHGPLALARRLRRGAGVRAIRLIDHDGSLRTI
jgi:thiamine biosynthesis lipoprotein